MKNCTWCVIATLTALAAGGPAVGGDETVLEDWQAGRVALEHGRYDEAARSFSGYRERHPEQAYGWVMEGRALWEAGDRDEAARRFERALEIEPGNPDAVVHLATNAYNGGQYEETLSRVLRLTEVPDRLQPFYDRLMGSALIRANRDPELAADHLSRAALADDVSKRLLGLAYLRAGSSAQAFTVLDGLCPPSGGETRTAAWARCLDGAGCDGLDDRLEILRRLPSAEPIAPPSDDTIVEVIRLHLEYGRCGSATLTSLLEGIEARHSDSCQLLFLRGLLSRCDGSADIPDTCELMTRAQACFTEGRDDEWPTLTGPLVDPASRELLDPSWRYRADFCESSLQARE